MTPNGNCSPSTHPTAQPFAFERLFDGFFPNPKTTPIMDVSETEDRYFVEMELPGFTIDSLDISIVGKELHLKGERKHERADDRTWHRRDQRRTRIDEVLRFPSEIDVEHVEARFAGGILMIELPKTRSMLPRKIEIKG